MKLEIEKVYNSIKKRDIAIICLSYNQKKLTENFIKNIKKQKFVPDIIILDSGSTDGTFTHLKTLFKDITILKARKNYGGAGGFYIAQKYAYDKNYEYVMFGENDLTLLSKNLIKKLYENAKKNNSFCVVAKDRMNSNKMGFIFHTTIISKETLNTVKFVNANYFFRGDDLDYMLRLDKNNIKTKAINVFFQHPIEKEISSASTIYFINRNDLNNQFLYKGPIFLFNSIFYKSFNCFNI